MICCAQFSHFKTSATKLVALVPGGTLNVEVIGMLVDYKSTQIYQKNTEFRNSKPRNVLIKLGPRSRPS